MQSGMLITEKFNRSWGPAYALWYKLLALFESDSIRLYYLNYRLMAILPSIALFIFLAISNTRLWVSFSLGLFFLFSTINLPVWPKVSHYCIFIILIGLSLMRYIPLTLVKISFISVFVLYISYARPEFYLTYLAVMGLWFIALFYKSFRSKRAIIISLLFFLFELLVQGYMGIPLFNFQGDRSALAFAQHFMFNYFQWNHIDQDFWITWMPYYQELFHNATSIREAYQINPKLFDLHFLTNIQTYFSQAFNLFSDAMLPEKVISIPLKGRLAILFLGGAIMLVVTLQDRYLSAVLKNFKRNTLALIILLLICAPTFASSLIIYPRTHYIIFQYFLLIYIICNVVFPITKINNPYNIYSFVFSGIVFITVWLNMPSTKDYTYFDLWRKEPSLANLKTVEKLRSLHYTQPIHLLENEGGMNIFLGKNYSWIRGFMKDTTWTTYLKKEQVDIIYVTPSLIKYPTLKSDSTWYAFINSPEKYGFKKVRTGNFIPYLLIKKDLLEQ